MTIKGNLKDMNLSSIVTLNCNEGNQACLTINCKGQEATVFFDNGQIVHAALDSEEGTEVIYELLSWEEGTFEIEQNVSPPKRSITTNWSGILLEGMRRVDENAAGRDGQNGIKKRKEVKGMSKLNDMLKEMAGEIPGLAAAGITGADGMTIAEYSADPNFKMEVAAAQFALIMKLVEKSTNMMGDTTDDVLVTTKGAYLLARFLGTDNYYHLGVAVAKEGSSLGNVRLITQQFANDLLNAIPKRGK